MHRERRITCASKAVAYGPQTHSDLVKTCWPFRTMGGNQHPIEISPTSAHGHAHGSNTPARAPRSWEPSENLGVNDCQQADSRSQLSVERKCVARHTAPLTITPSAENTKGSLSAHDQAHGSYNTPRKYTPSSTVGETVRQV